MGESGSGPGGGGVTIRAGGGESGRGVVRVISGGVLGLVARVTVRRRTREDVVDVAACAGRVDVRPGKRELGGAVIERGGRPGYRSEERRVGKRCTTRGCTDR